MPQRLRSPQPLHYTNALFNNPIPNSSHIATGLELKDREKHTHLRYVVHSKGFEYFCTYMLP